MSTELMQRARHSGQLAPSDLYSLEEYSRLRGELRANILAHKKDRRLAIGSNATLYFEDRLTMQYQVQVFFASRRYLKYGISPKNSRPTIPLSRMAITGKRLS